MPPVTAERSPPASRITGADSPVIALSSTEAMPSTISPSAGTMSSTFTRTRSPGFSARLEMISWVSASTAASLRAGVSDWVARRLSARALPRPSAKASAKLAK